MSERATVMLLESPLVAAYDVCCRAPRSGFGAVEAGGVAQIVLPRRGVFVVQRRGTTIVVDTTTAIVLGAEDEYRVRHPADGGDDCTVLVLAPDVLEEAVGTVAGRLAHLEARDHIAVCLVTAGLREQRSDDLEPEEATLLLATRLLRGFANGPGTSGHIGAAQRLRVERVRALLASAPAARWNLALVAQAMQCSPFHLARQFRAHTGETMGRYLLRLRLGFAVDRLAHGESNLAALALECGFANHSHFSARFRKALGLTPSAARAGFASHQLRELARLVRGPDP